MKQFLGVLVFFTCTAATCGPLYTRFNVADKPDGIQDSGHNVIIRIKAEDAHYPQGNQFTVYYTIINTTKDTLRIQKFPPLTARTNNFDLSGARGSVVYPGLPKFNHPEALSKVDRSEILSVYPSDSLKAFYSFNNNFQGSYKKFRSMLKNAEVYLKFHSILRNDEELQFEEFKLVIQE